jgi:hypothetical protein
MCTFLQCPLTLFRLRNRLNASNLIGSKPKIATLDKFVISNESVNYLRNKGLHNYSSTNETRMIKSRRMRWAGHITHGKKRYAYNIFVGKSEEATRKT